MTLVSLRIMPGWHFLLLQQGFLTTCHVVVVHAPGRYQRGIDEAQHLTVVLRILRAVGGINLFCKSDIVMAVIGQIENPDLQQAFIAQIDRQEVAKQVKAFDLGLLSVRYVLTPGLLIGVILLRHPQQAKVNGILVGKHPEFALSMLDGILDAMLARPEQSGCYLRIGSIQEVLFASNMTAQRDIDLPAVLAVTEAHEKGLIGLLEYLFSGAVRQAMA